VCIQFRLEGTIGLNFLFLGLAQVYLGGTLASLLGRLWALRVSISIMIIGV